MFLVTSVFKILNFVKPIYEHWSHDSSLCLIIWRWFLSHSNTWIRLPQVVIYNELFLISSQFNSKFCPSEQSYMVFRNEVGKINSFGTKVRWDKYCRYLSYIMYIFPLTIFHYVSNWIHLIQFENLEDKIEKIKTWRTQMTQRPYYKNY